MGSSIIFWACLNCAMDFIYVFGDILRSFFMQIRVPFIAKNVDNVRFCVSQLCELQLFTALGENDIPCFTSAAGMHGELSAEHRKRGKSL